MSRTRRIYNSYRKYGRYIPKQGSGWGYIKNEGEKKKWVRMVIQPFDLSLEYHHKDGSYNIQYNRRWHPFHVWCMGGCHYCRNGRGYYKWKEAKQNRNRKEMKFLYNI